jgi:hypothetical protein
MLATLPVIVSCTTRPVAPVPASPVDVVSPVSPVVTPVTPTVMTGTQTEVAPIEKLPATPVTPIAPVPSPVVPVSSARTRTETVSYRTPAGSDQVEFSVTVESGVITAATATSKAENDISKKWQASFATNVSAKVVGKKVSDIGDMAAIGGASLTTGAFDQFVSSF